jgi:ribosomal protein S6
MRYYESLYIVNPNFEQERLNEVMQEVAEKVGDYGFKIINHRIWVK